MAIPLMCLAAVIEERRQATEALATRLRLEEVLSRLSAASSICRAPRRIGRSTNGWDVSASTWTSIAS